MNNNKLTLKEMPAGERPYERIEQFGASGLTDAELLAVIIKTGSVNETAVELSRQVLKACGDRGLSALQDMEIDELRHIKGIGKVKAIQLKAICELAVRMSGGRNILNRKTKIISFAQIGDILLGEMELLKKEVLKVVLLDRKWQIIKISDISIGTIDQALVHPREVFSDAIRNFASAIVIAHNHPSGDTEPSGDDIETTRRLILAGEIVGIEVVDHIIVGNGKYMSMHMAGIIKKIKTSLCAEN